MHISIERAVTGITRRRSCWAWERGGGRCLLSRPSGTLHDYLQHWEQAIECCEKSRAGMPDSFGMCISPPPTRGRATIRRRKRPLSSAEAPFRLHRPDVCRFGRPHVRRSDLQRAISAYRRRVAQGGGAGGREEDEVSDGATPLPAGEGQGRGDLTNARRRMTLERREFARLLRKQPTN